MTRIVERPTLRFLYRVYTWLACWFLRPLLIIEASASTNRRNTERLIEYSFCLRHLRPWGGAKVLDVGTGTSSWPHLLWFSGLAVTALDKISGYEAFALRNRHYWVRQHDITQAGDLRPGRFAAVTCISTLEHIDQHEQAMQEMRQLLQLGGLLLLTVPFTSGERIDDLLTYLGDDSCFSAAARRERFKNILFSEQDLRAWLSLGYILVEREDWQVFSGTHYMQGQPLARPILLRTLGEETDLTGPPSAVQVCCLALRKTQDYPPSSEEHS